MDTKTKEDGLGEEGMHSLSSSWDRGHREVVVWELLL